MSIHLMLAAAYLPKEEINKTQKLVLMKIADSADDQTRLAHPGLERMMAWAGVGEKAVITVVTELVGLGLVERVEVGRAGHRAEYRVFPHGVPPIPSTEELSERRRAARRAPTNSRLARTARRRKPSAAARTQQDVAAREEGGAPAGAPEEEGLSEEGHGEGQKRVAAGKPTGFPCGNPEGFQRGTLRVSTGKPSGLPEGNPEGFQRETPSFPSPSSLLPYPPTPTHGPAADAGAETGEPPAGCPKHPVPVGNCRGCGTNPRAGREQARKEAAAREHVAQQEWLREFFAEQQRRVAETDPQALEMARQRVRELARMNRRRPNTRSR
ncbi:helix-turn-helix domain-containing protein [Streptomyces sp. NPDC006140]|uniref:helix-turn-helix domain-containing protein n=1 Tax=Streptomyces sp. NPDC006140 TaxID=3154579 RepID=UPI00340765B1